MPRTSRAIPALHRLESPMPTTTPSLLAILTHTPIYVWAIFALILFLGYQRTRDRTVSLWRLLLLPLILGVVAVSGFAGAGLSTIPAVVVGLAIGGVAGWLLERDGATRRLPAGRLWVRGEWWSLVQIVLIFGFRYSIAVSAAVDPTLATDPTWHLATVFVSSLLTALILGRTAARLRVYFTTRPAEA